MGLPSDDHDDGAEILRARLRSLRVEPPAGDFAASLHRKLSAAGEPDPVGFWRKLWPAQIGGSLAVRGFASAVLACAVIAVIAVKTNRPHHELLVPASEIAQTVAQPAPDALASAELPTAKVAMVRINLSAEVAVESAQIRVTLPEGLVFWSEGQELAQRSFEWSQPLHAGDNDIPIAVRGLRAGKYTMTVTAKMGKEHVEDNVLLQVVNG